LNNLAQAHLESARMLHAQGRLQEAERHYFAAEQLTPGDPTIAAMVAMFCMDAGRFEEAAFRFERLRTERPDVPIGHLGHGNALFALGRPAEALDAYEHLLRLEPDNSAGYFGRGNALQTLGRLIEARKSFERAVALAPDFPPYHYPLAAIARFRENDTRLTALERLANNKSRYPEIQTADLHFALGKAYDDLGRYPEAFEQYRKGNAIRRRYLAYDEAHELESFRALATAFTKELFARDAPTGDPAPEPVFIVGMPRSGSSLVEQILASHPQTFGAGELLFLPQLIQAGNAGHDFPFGVAGLSDKALHQLGSFYALAVRRLAPQAHRIVDKALSNFRFVGLIRLALPKGRIIHMRRDRLDTCLSCYFHLFAQGVNFAHDLGELGRYYRSYEGLMEHWRSVLPPGSMLDVDYEALVENPESEVGRILDYCGLAWDPRCLDFHHTDRVVHTVSAAQVRQPLYRSGVGRWRHYETFLGPLFEALDSDAPAF
jgi:tetratricopeptide (TPR) repeat protein